MRSAMYEDDDVDISDPEFASFASDGAFGAGALNISFPARCLRMSVDETATVAEPSIEKRHGLGAITILLGDMLPSPPMPKLDAGANPSCGKTG